MVTENRLGRHRQVRKDKFDKEQLRKGIEVEHEHTDWVKTAQEIAKDHLSEIPDYYDRLAYIERPDFWTMIEKSKQGLERTAYQCPKCKKGIIIYERNEHYFYCNNKNCDYKVTVMEVLFDYVSKN